METEHGQSGHLVHAPSTAARLLFPLPCPHPTTLTPIPPPAPPCPAGYWPLYRYRPGNAAGEGQLVLDSKKIKGELEEFLKLENR